MLAGEHASHLCHQATCVNPAHVVVEHKEKNEAHKGCKARGPIIRTVFLDPILGINKTFLLYHRGQEWVGIRRDPCKEDSYGTKPITSIARNRHHHCLEYVGPDLNQGAGEQASACPPSK